MVRLFQPGPPNKLYESDTSLYIAGSDVANINTTAELQGDFYIVNGCKKWITNGVWADYCTAAVRTGGPGKGGISALIIPMKTQGVSCRKLENSGVSASGKSMIARSRN